MSNHTNQLNELAAKINDFDHRIGKTNNSFLSKVKNIETIERKLEKHKLSLQASAKDISNEYGQVQLAFDHYLLEKSERHNESDIKNELVHFEILAKKLKVLKKAQKESNDLLDLINQQEQLLITRKKEEQEIYALIVELENTKREMSQTYVSKMETKNRLQSSLDKAVAKRRVIRKKHKKLSKGKADFKFLLPLTDYVNVKISNGKKRGGINFKYSETVPIKAPGNGKIVYTGELASYGKVLIIDHGKDVRSVLLGDIVSKVTKNAAVKEGQIVGYTMGDPGTIKTIYYEVRKKNKVQNTLLWLENDQRKSIKI